MCVALWEVLYKRFSVCDVKYCFTHINLDQYDSGNENYFFKSSRTGVAFEGDLFKERSPISFWKYIVIDCLFEIDKTIFFLLCNGQ